MPAHAIFNKLRMLTGILLVVAVFLPLYAVSTSWGGDTQSNYVWDFVRGDLVGAGLLVLAYAGPALVILLHRCHLSRARSLLLFVTEPFLLVMSAAIVIASASSAITLLPVLGPWLLIPASASMDSGAWLALAADGVLLSLWGASMGWRLHDVTLDLSAA